MVSGIARRPRRVMLTALRAVHLHAAARGEVELFYQPQIRLADGKLLLELRVTENIRRA